MDHDPESNPNSLDDIPTPSVSDDEEEGLEENELRTAIKKCTSIGNFGVLKVDEINSLIKKGSIIPPEDVEGKVFGDAICNVTNKLGKEDRKPEYPFPLFRLIFTSEVSGKIYLLNQWLSHKCRKNIIKAMNPGHLHKLLQTARREKLQVLAMSPSNGQYGRAIVQQRISSSEVLVTLTDSGESVIVPTKTLRLTRSDLIEVNKLSTWCILYGITDYGITDARTDILEYEFKKIITHNSDILVAQLDHFNIELDAAEIHLYIWSDENKITYLNKILQENYDSLSKAPQSLPFESDVAFPTAGELLKQIQLDIDADDFICKPCKDVEKGPVIYKITHVVSPTQMYIVRVSQNPNCTRIIPHWHKSMQNCYNDPQNAKLLELAGGRLFTKRCYVYYCTSIDSWERVHVLSVDNEKMSCHVFMVDLGYFIDIPQSDIFEIDPVFLRESVLAVTAKLQHVEPYTTDDNETELERIEDFDPDTDELEGECNFWPIETIKWLKAKAEGRYFFGVSVPDILGVKRNMAERNMKLYKSKNESNIFRKFGMIFVELSQTNRISLNAELCFNYGALCFGPGAASIDQFYESHRLPEFDYGKMREYLLGEELALFVDPGPQPPINDDFQRFLNKEINLRNQEPIANDTDYIKWLKTEPEFFSKLLPTNCLPGVIRNNISQCEITCTISPCCFYVQLMAKLPELRSVMKNMGIQMRKRRPIIFEKVKVGMPIALELDYYDTYFNGPTWHRAVVKQLLRCQKMVKAILIDYGLEVIVPSEDVYLMPSYFQTLPGYCFRVHLNILGRRPDFYQNWSPRAIEDFRNLTDIFHGKSVKLYCWKSNPFEENISLDVFNQNLCFDQTTTQWKKVAFDETVTYKNRSFEAPHALVRQRSSTKFVENEDGSTTKIVKTVTVSGLPPLRSFLPPTHSLSSDDFTSSCDSRRSTTERTNLSSVSSMESSPIPSSYDSADRSPLVPPVLAGIGEDLYNIPFKRLDTDQFETLCGHLFVSSGINFAYEPLKPAPKEYKFCPGWDQLVFNKRIFKHS